jgi:hypothetical protein
MSVSVTVPHPDLATTLQHAVAALAKAIEGKPEMDQLLAEMVRISGQALKAGGAGVWVAENADRPELVLEHNLAQLQLMASGAGGGGAIPGIKIAIRRCAREAKPLIVPAFFVDAETVDTPVNPSPFELLFVPMKLHGKVAMVLMMAVPPPPANDPGVHRTLLNFLIRMAGSVEQSLTDRHLTLLEKDRGTSSKLVRFTDRVHKHLFLGQVAVDIANLTRDALEADRVTVELYPRTHKKVMAVSNVDEPNKRAHVFQVQRLLFDYVRDHQAPVVLDREAVQQLVSDPVLQDAAAAYFASTDFDAFLISPIKADDPASPVLGVMLVEYASTEKAQSGNALLGEVCRLCAGSVANAIEVESTPLVKWFHTARGVLKNPSTTKRKMGLIVAGVLIIGIAIVSVIPFDFSIKADCQIRPSAQLSIVAPMEERIVDVPVRAGEHVYTKAQRAALGDAVKPLARFDATDLVAQRAEAIGKLQELQVELKEAEKGEKNGNMSKIGEAKGQLTQVQQQIDFLNHQIEDCTVYSPIEGTVLTENVEQKRWSTPKKSEPLMEVASFSDWELVVDIPESEVATVRGALEKASRTAASDGRADAGIEVEYILYPWPDQRYSIHAKGVGTLLPASQQSKNANVFRLQVKLDPKSLPPGIAMSGFTGRAKIHVGRKPLATQWTRGAMRLLKMTLFF